MFLRQSLEVASFVKEMKKGKKIAITVISLLLIVSLCGCGKTANKKNMQKEIEAAWNTNEEYDKNSFFAELEKNSKFEVTEVMKTEKDCYEVSLNVTSPDILDDLKAYQESIETVPSDEEINDKIKEIINSAQPKTTQQTLTVYRTDSGFSVSFNDEFIDAMNGYSYSYCISEMEKVLEGNE